MSLTKLEVPAGYSPEVRVYQHAETKRWFWRYSLPDGQLFSQTVKLDEKKAKSEAKRKQRDLVLGLFSDREVAKMQKAKSGNILTPSQLAEEYVRITSVSKTGATINGEASLIRATFRMLEEDLEVKSLVTLRSEDLYRLRDLLQKRVAKSELRPISANNRLKSLKKVFRWAKKRSLLLSNPAAELDPIEVREADRGRTVTLTPVQIRKIVQAKCELHSGFDVKSFFLLLYATGMRPGELLHLEWNDIDLEHRQIRLTRKPNCPTRYGVGWQPKWGKERLVPLNDTALLILSGMPRFSSVGYVRGKSDPLPARFVFVTKDRVLSRAGKPAWKRIDDARFAWAKLLRTAGVWTPEAESLLGRSAPPFHRHDVRRTWSADAKSSGSTIEETSQVMGNNPLVNLQHYRERPDEAKLHLMTARHPSNRLLSCIASVSEPDSGLEPLAPKETKGESSA